MAELTIEERSGFGLATIMARRGVPAAAIGTAVGLEAPLRPAIAQGPHGLALVGTGPGAWLAYTDEQPTGWTEQLREKLAGLASVSDQSGGYVITRLAGADARVILQRGAPIDLHPNVFGPGSAATTVIAHIGVVLWQLDDKPTYEVATFRSFRDSFHHWVEQAAAAL